MDQKVNGQKIKHLREQKGWTQEMLKQQSEISIRTIIRMENENSGSITSLKLIAEKLGISDFAELLYMPPFTTSRIEHGKQIFDFITDTEAFDFDFEKVIKEQKLIEIITSFFQELQDYTDVWEGLGFAQRGDAVQEFQEMIDELNQHDLWIFGGMSKREFGNDKPPTLFNAFTLRILPKNSAAINTDLQPLVN